MNAEGQVSLTEYYYTCDAESIWADCDPWGPEGGDEKFRYRYLGFKWQKDVP